MNPHKGLVLDANILLRGMLGQRVLHLLIKYQSSATFYSPDYCFDQLREALPKLCARRKIDPGHALATLSKLSVIVQSMPQKVYNHYEGLARERIELRDPTDWPIAALALVLELPIWTEDTDFFGSGYVDN